MMRILRIWLLAGIALLATLLPAMVAAHEMSMAEMEVRETAPGEFLWMWSATNDKRPGAEGLNPLWPESCIAEGSALRCGAGGLKGMLTIEGVGKQYSAALVKIFWLDGQSRVYTLTGGHPKVQLYGSANDTRGSGEIAAAYTMLGIEHILTGLDHILFVIALLCMVGFNRRLVGTITAFTAAHTVTLAASALGWLTLRPAPVEAAIALSIVLVAGEALHNRNTLSRRMPAIVAFVFGLVHGLGFAGALKDIGLPQSNVPLALLTFNVGVEISQLMVVALAYCLVRWLSRYTWFERARKPLLYLIGITASYWSFLRVATIVM
ncbi:HupE/UreJ family protein [Uliginosibacterium sp. H3]|uniref:HupE/UreJ family protein n=1 Tax=Uliginosibacterium silvisoli TaxID=3114758 RepID=A0ABU6K4Y0_9RHOO|nr:HupE/UreJ family protein [Uliginosibacterium sp. H3]